MTIQFQTAKAYFSALNGNISIDGSDVPVFSDSSVPPVNQYPFILISTINALQSTTNGCKIYDVFANIDVITGNRNEIGFKQAFEIASQIDAIINPDSGNLLMDAPFEIGFTKMQNAVNFADKNDIYFIYRVLLTYQHKINL